MGGSGFFGLKLQGDYGTRWLTYCIWATSEHILFDDRVLQCHPNYAEQYNPLIGFDDYSKNLEAIKSLTNMTIEEIILSKKQLAIKLIDNNCIFFAF